jgi:hypothetical protein
VTAGSDELQKVGTCFLQLKLVLNRGNGKRENVLMGKYDPHNTTELSAHQVAMFAWHF